MSDYELLKMCL